MMTGFHDALRQVKQEARTAAPLVVEALGEGDVREAVIPVTPDIDGVELLRPPPSPAIVRAQPVGGVGLVWLPDVFVPSLGNTIGGLRLTQPRVATVAGCPQEEATIEVLAEGESATDWQQPPTFGAKADKTVYVIEVTPWDKKGRGPKGYEQPKPNQVVAYAVMRVEVVVKLSGAEPEKGKEEECCCIADVKRSVKKIKPAPSADEQGKWLDDNPKKEPPKKKEGAKLEDADERQRMQDEYTWNTFYRSKSCKKWVLGDTPGRAYDKRKKANNEAQHEFESIYKIVATFKGKGCPETKEYYYRVKFEQEKDGSFKKGSVEAKGITKEEADKAK